jgi:hypothetical protein
MRSKKSQLSIALSLLYALSMVVSLSAAAQANASDLPPRPLPQPPASRGDGALNPEGYIQLHVPSARADLWTAIQWQDHDGIWHPVEGWQGTLDEIENGKGKKTWWIGKADMGTGPFRWLIYSSYQGKLLATSSPFYLPGLAGQTVQVEVSLAP